MKNPQISNFMKMQPVEAKLFHADRQTDMRKLIVASHNVATVPNKNVHIVHEGPGVVLVTALCY